MWNAFRLDLRSSTEKMRIIHTVLVWILVAELVDAFVIFKEADNLPIGKHIPKKKYILFYKDECRA